MSIMHLERITIEHDPDELFDGRVANDGFDREGIICEYAVSLSMYLADIFGPVRVEVTPVSTLRQTRIQIEADVDSPTELEPIHAAIEAAMAEHYERGEFWIEPE